MTPGAFLDRDGVINRALIRDGLPFPPRSIEELEILPGVADALRRLKDAGYRLVVVTNQPDVARGTVLRKTVDEINGALMARLPLDAIRTCFHDSEDRCDCRKPQPGLLVAAAKDFDIDLRSSWMVGDRWRDIAAGLAVGCRTIFIDCGYNEQQPPRADYRVKSLSEGVNIILQEST